MIRHKNSLRFPRLVANGLNTFEVCKDDVGQLLGNGGSEDETFDFFNHIFNVERKFSYQDFSHMIIQLTNPYRSYFEFELNGVSYKTKILNAKDDFTEERKSALHEAALANVLLPAMLYREKLYDLPNRS